MLRTAVLLRLQKYRIKIRNVDVLSFLNRIISMITAQVFLVKNQKKFIELLNHPLIIRLDVSLSAQED